jgi:hypothetical protein
MTIEENNKVEFATGVRVIEDGFTDLEKARAEIARLNGVIEDMEIYAQERTEQINKMMRDKAVADEQARDYLNKANAVYLPFEKAIIALIDQGLFDERIEGRVADAVEDKVADEMESALSYGGAGDTVKELAREVLSDELGEALDNADLDGLREQIADEIKSALESATISIDF